MIKGRLGDKGIDSDAALRPAVSTSNMLMNRTAQKNTGGVGLTEVKYNCV